jgi:hypothetical protein
MVKVSDAAGMKIAPSSGMQALQGGQDRQINQQVAGAARRACSALSTVADNIRCAALSGMSISLAGIVHAIGAAQARYQPSQCQIQNRLVVLFEQQYPHQCLPAREHRAMRSSQLRAPRKLTVTTI